jgi:hypothetical protein
MSYAELLSDADWFSTAGHDSDLAGDPSRAGPARYTCEGLRPFRTYEGRSDPT